MPVLFSEDNILGFLLFFITFVMYACCVLWKGLYEKHRIVWLAKIFIPPLILSGVLILTIYYISVSDYKYNKKVCSPLSDKGYIMIGNKCARPIGNDEYIEYNKILRK